MHVCNNPLLSESERAVHSGEALYRPRATTSVATFEYSGALQFWTVPESGIYRITARGAKAADGHHRCGFPLLW
jgi:hypothetical protein